MEVEATGIGLDPLALAAKHFVQRQIHLLGRQIPERYLQRLMEWQREAPLFAATRPPDTIAQRHGRLTF